LECHDDLSAEADLDLLSLDFSPDDSKNLKRWIRIFDRVKTGEMPPEEEPRPQAEELEKFLADLQTPLIDSDEKRIAELGRARVRRLNRGEFETALTDIFRMPFHVREELPEDARSHGFPTVGEALNVSSVQIEAYLNTLDRVFDRVTTLYEKPIRRTHRLTFLENVDFMQVHRKGGPFLIQEDGVAIFATEKFSHLKAGLSQWTAPHTGRYRVKISTYAIRSNEPVIVSLRAGGVGHQESNHVPHEFLKHMPVVEGEPQVFEWEGWLERGHFLHVYPTSLPAMRFAGKKEELQQHRYTGPAAVIQWVDVDGPIIDQWPPEHHRALWGDVPTKEIPAAMQNKDPIEHLDHPPSRIAQPRMTRLEKPDKGSGNKWIYDPEKQDAGGEPIHRTALIPDPPMPTLQFAPINAEADVARLLREFAKRAFRHEPEQAELEPAMGLVRRWLDEGRDFETAMRVGFKALLTSPGFLYRQGTLPDGNPRLDGYELAERLAFFLWNGLPDDELRDLASSESITKPDVVTAQVERLLRHEKFDRFLNEFLDSWLDLRLIDFTVPDEKLYPEFDKLAKLSMVEETRAFVKKLITEDLPVRNVIDSDFAMLNWRLAKLYDLPPVAGMEVREVSLPIESPRGGIMTQGSILKVTANGTTTSPVVRGVWLLEKIMGVTPDPPPPGIPAIEPDIRGATTVRELLNAHRNSESCASCHRKIDPAGLALENFDVVGGWRENYRALKDELADVIPKYNALSKMPIFYEEGPPVDASYQMADGSTFENIEGFKKILLENPRQIARGIVEKLIIYSTGAEVSFSDRADVEAILDRAEQSEFGFRTLIREVVLSDLFNQK